MADTVSPSAVIIPLPPPRQSDRAARLARIYAAVEEVAPWYAGGLPPDLLCPA